MEKRPLHREDGYFAPRILFTEEEVKAINWDAVFKDWIKPMNAAKAKAKLPTLTNEELATLAAMVADEQRKRKLKSRCQRDYTLHKVKRSYAPPQNQKDEGIPISVRNAVVREFRDNRNGVDPPFLSPAHFEQIFNKHHPGGSMMEDDWCDIDENEY